MTNEADAAASGIVAAAQREVEAASREGRPAKQIHTSLIGAMRRICELGIGKTSQNTQQNYRFRGIDAAMNELSPILVNNRITATPKYSELNVSERQRGVPTEGKFTRCATVKCTLKFEASDGTFVEAEAYGEGIDTGDKAVVKAQTVAYRTILFQQFVVPLMSMDSELYEEHGDDDGGSAESERQSAPPPKPAAPAPAKLPPYSDDQVKAWSEQIMSGKKTAKAATAQIKTKYSITPEQIATLQSFEVTK